MDRAISYKPLLANIHLIFLCCFFYKILYPFFYILFYFKHFTEWWWDVEDISCYLANFKLSLFKFLTTFFSVVSKCRVQNKLGSKQVLFLVCSGSFTSEIAWLLKIERLHKARLPFFTSFYLQYWFFSRRRNELG